MFVSVYAAFALSDWDRQRKDDAKRRQLRQAIGGEIRMLTEQARAARGEIARLDSLFVGAMRAGAMPRLQPLYSRTGQVTPFVWSASTSAGGLELFDVPQFVRISRFYNIVSDGLSAIEEMRKLSDDYLIPAADAPPAEFYDPATRQLRQKYMWYPVGLRKLYTFGDMIVTHGDSLLAELGPDAHGAKR